MVDDETPPAICLFSSYIFPSITSSPFMTLLDLPYHHSISPLAFIVLALLYLLFHFFVHAIVCLLHFSRELHQIPLHCGGRSLTSFLQVNHPSSAIVCGHIMSSRILISICIPFLHLIFFVVWSFIW